LQEMWKVLFSDHFHRFLVNDASASPADVERLLPVLRGRFNFIAVFVTRIETVGGRLVTATAYPVIGTGCLMLDIFLVVGDLHGRI